MAVSVHERCAIRFLLARPPFPAPLAPAVEQSADGGSPDVFIAYASSFDGFHGWANAPATAQDDAGDGLHVGPLRVYWSQLPAPRLDDVPDRDDHREGVGEHGRHRSATVFAMVKRGGGFNSGGASGWEWFSLQNNTDGSVNILWRGVVAPAGETYANQAIGDCNGCHALAVGNDYVWDSALQLSSF